MQASPAKANPAPKSSAAGKATLWVGRLLSALPFPPMLFGAGAKLTHAHEAVEGFYRLGLPERAMHPIGLLEITCVVLYAIPRTAILGAILVTGYMGGAILANVRAGEPIVAPVLMGVFAWAGLFLRDQRLRVLLPLRSSRWPNRSGESL